MMVKIQNAQWYLKEIEKSNSSHRANVTMEGARVRIVKCMRFIKGKGKGKSKKEALEVGPKADQLD